jgi:hypothetical protein
MTYEIVDFDGGDVLGVYGSEDAAMERAEVLLDEDPDLAGDIAIVTIGDDGARVGEPILVEHHQHAAEAVY